METTKKLYNQGKKKGYFKPKLELFIKKDKDSPPKPTGPHKVKILGEKLIRKKDYYGKEREAVKLNLEENDEKKYYSFFIMNKDSNKMHYLIERLKDYEKNDEFIMEGKTSSDRSYIEIRDLEEKNSENKKEDEGGEDEGGEDEIPVIEEDDDIGEPPF